MNPQRRKAWQEAMLRSRASTDMVKNAPVQAGRLQRVELKHTDLGSMASLGRLAPMTFGDVRSIGDLLSTPGSRTSKRHSPAAWALDAPLPLAYSHVDLATLASVGKEMMKMFGAEPGDLVLNLISPINFRDHQQVAMGALRSHISHVALDPAKTEEEMERVSRLDPSVVAGDINAVTELLESAVVLHRLHTVIVTGAAHSPARWERLREATEAAGVLPLRMHAPAGALAAWAQCRGGEGLHTWPEHELVELIDPVSGLPVADGRPGLVLWTGIGWRCSTMLRMQLSAFVRLESETCPSCGRHAQRVIEEADIVSFSDVLDSNEGLDGWFAELQGGVETDELVVWLALAEDANALLVLGELTAALGDSVRLQTSDIADVRSRIEAASGERFGDRRAFPA